MSPTAPIQARRLLARITPARSDALLDLEILKSERIRSAVLFAIFCGAALFWIFTYIFSRDQVNAALGFAFPFAPLLIGIGAGAVYEGGLVLIQNFLIRKRRHFPEIPRYLHTIFETSMLGVLLWFLCGEGASPLFALHSPVVLIFFLFIILSILRLRMSMSVVTGAVAAFWYGGLALRYLPEVQPGVAPAYLSAVGPALGKAASMLVSGLAAGFVGVQLRRRLTDSMQMAEERNRVVGMFGQYVSPEVVDRLLQQKHELPAEVRHVCVMFLDIRNFTAFAEKRSPEEVITYLNDLFSELIEIVNRHRGIVNKFLGDGFMAVFGAPISSEGRDVQNAVQAALEILAKVEALNQSARIPPTRIGIGLHAGPAMTGSVGSVDRKEYTIIGDTVNLAARVEQLNKEHGSELLATAAVLEQCDGQFAASELAAVQVRGREEAVRLFRLR